MMPPPGLFAAPSSPLNCPVLAPVTVMVMCTTPAVAPEVLSGLAAVSCQATSASSVAATATARTRVRGRTNADVIVSSPIATPVARGLRLFSRGSRETAPCYRYWVGGPDEPVIGGGPEAPEAGGGPPAAGPWLKLTTGTARSPSSAWKNANGLKPSAPAISEVGRVCSEML